MLLGILLAPLAGAHETYWNYSWYGASADAAEGVTVHRDSCAGYGRPLPDDAVHAVGAWNVPVYSAPDPEQDCVGEDGRPARTVILRVP